MRAPVPRDAASPPVISRTPCAGSPSMRQRPAAQHPPHRLAVDVAELLRAGDRRLGPLQRGLGLAPALVHDGHLRARRGEAVGAAGVARQLERVRRARQRAVGPAEEPQRQPRPVVAGDAGVVAQRGGERRVARRRRRRSASNSATPRSAYSSARANEPWWNRLQASSSDDSSSCSSMPARREPLALVRHVVRARELAAQLVQRREREQDGDERLVVRQPRGEARARAAARPRPRPPTSRRSPRAPARARRAARPPSACAPSSTASSAAASSAARRWRMPSACALRPNARSAASRRKRTARSGSRPAMKWKPSSAAMSDARRAVGVGEVRADARVQPRPRVARAAARRAPRGAGRAGTRGRRRAARSAACAAASAAQRASTASRSRSSAAASVAAEKSRPATLAALQQLGVVGRQPVELVADVRAQRRRDARLERRARAASSSHGAAALGERALGTASGRAGCA